MATLSFYQMRARYTRSIGIPVLDEESGETAGTVRGILLNPDTGVVEGFFVRAPALSREDLFLSHIDILHWGLRVTIRHADALSPLEDLVRLQPLLAGNRPVIGQRIRTESGRNLGRCADVQFSTKDFRLEWIFPRRFFRLSEPIPVSQILEVRPDAIILRDTAAPVKEGGVGDPLGIISSLPEAA